MTSSHANETKHGLRFVDRAVGARQFRIFRNTSAVQQTCRTVVSLAGVDALMSHVSVTLTLSSDMHLSGKDIAWDASSTRFAK